MSPCCRLPHDHRALTRPMSVRMRMLLNMCGDPSEHSDPGHMIARWLGMYSIHNCTSPEASDVPACDDKGRRESPAPALPIPS